MASCALPSHAHLAKWLMSECVGTGVYMPTLWLNSYMYNHLAHNLEVVCAVFFHENPTWRGYLALICWPENANFPHSSHTESEKVHSMPMCCGYLCACSGEFLVLHTTHNCKVYSLLSIANYYICHCHIDNIIYVIAGLKLENMEHCVGMSLSKLIVLKQWLKL